MPRASQAAWFRSLSVQDCGFDATMAQPKEKRMSTDQSTAVSRRTFANGLGAAVLAVSAGSAVAAPATPANMAAMHAGMADDMRACILECQKCSTTCTSALIDICMKTGGRHATPDHVQVMLDCVQICATTADFMARGSAFHAQMCRVCAEVCEACARSCDGLEGMAACVANCRECAKRCRAMAAMA